MAEYIEREALLKKIDDYHHTSHIQSITRETEKEKTLWWGIHGGVNYCRNSIIDVPAADVVEVVRCKECKRCELRYPAKAIGEEAIEGYWCHSNQKYVTPSDFCSYGERKGDCNNCNNHSNERRE